MSRTQEFPCKGYFQAHTRLTFCKSYYDMHSSDFRKRYRAYRNKASGYITKKEVRDYFFKKYSGCEICGCNSNLSIDHIVSVWKCAKEEIDIDCMNCELNLRVLCRSCNSAISPIQNKVIPCSYCKKGGEW